MAAKIVEGRVVDERVSFDINPTSREILEDLVRHGHLASLIRAGARLHQAGCNGCIGMGQAPASGRLSLRTVPRNFPGRSGTRDDRVCLVSPETAAASALTGEITDPRTLEMDYPRVREPREPSINDALLEPPPGEIAERATPLEKGPNIGEIPDFEPLPNELTLPILLKAGDDLSTDEILPAGARVLPFRSNVAELSAFSFKSVDRDYAARARSVREASGHAIVGGRNYGQGSSREHAALGPRWLGLRVVLAKGFARIHMENLVNFGVLPVTLESADDYQRLEKGHELAFERLHDRLRDGRLLEIDNHSTGETLLVRHRLSSRQIDVILAGGLINRVREQLRNREGGPG